VKLLLLLAMTTTAAADGFTGGLRLGAAYVGDKKVDNDVAYLGAVEGGYQWGRLRPSLALDLTTFRITSGDTSIGYLLESVSAKLQVDVIADAVFAFAGIGITLDDDGVDTHTGLHLQAGVGGRLWLSHANAVRLDASYARDTYPRTIGAYGGALGYEHYF